MIHIFFLVCFQAKHLIAPCHAHLFVSALFIPLLSPEFSSLLSTSNLSTLTPYNKDQLFYVSCQVRSKIVLTLCRLYWYHTTCFRNIYIWRKTSKTLQLSKYSLCISNFLDARYRNASYLSLSSLVEIHLSFRWWLAQRYIVNCIDFWKQPQSMYPLANMLLSGSQKALLSFKSCPRNGFPVYTNR